MSGNTPFPDDIHTTFGLYHRPRKWAERPDSGLCTSGSECSTPTIHVVTNVGEVSRPRRLGVVKLALALLTVAVTLFAGSAAAVARDGLDVGSDITYEILDTGVVHVESTYTLKNTTPSSSDSRGVTNYYFYAYTTSVPSSAIDVVARSNGAELKVELDPVDSTTEVLRATISFPNMYNGQSRTVVLSYDIAGEAPRTPKSDQRVNAAYASFYVFGEGDDGNVSVSIVVPPAVDADLLGSPLTKATLPDGKVSYSSRNIADPRNWYAFISARKDTALVLNPVDAGGAIVDVRSWPGDQAWADFAIKDVREGLPALSSLIDEPLPIKGLQVIQATTPYLYGAAGWFRPSGFSKCEP